MAATHDDNFGNEFDEFREQRQRRRDIRKGSNWNETNLVGCTSVCLDQKLDGIGRLNLRSGLGERHFDEMNAGIPFSSRCGEIESRNRTAKAGIDRYVAAADMVERTQRVVRRMLKLPIAV